MNLAEGGLEAGTILVGKYRLEGILGQGGMGLVYRAQHLSLDEPIAIKVLRPAVSMDEATVMRFVREAQATVRLKSEHVARVHDVGTLDDGLPYMVMELLEGADLGQLVDANGAMVPHAAIDLVLQACDAIAEAHSLGIVHRDIKPTNLYVSFRPDQSAIVKVLDFGISKTTGADLSLTQTSSMLGTPAYMSPEQMRSARAVDARTDIWSIGCVLYELLEARQPFNALSFSEMCVMVAMDPPAQMTLAPELEPIVRRCLEKHPDQRYANVAELMRELATFAGDPDAARRYVTRAHRTLGLPVPANLDLPAALPPAGGYEYTPTPIPIESLRGIHGGPAAVAPTLTSVPRRSSRAVMIGAVLATLLGVAGSLAYIEATRDEPSAPAGASGEEHQAPGSAVPDLAAGSGSDLAADPDTGSAVDLAAGAGSGSGSAADVALGAGSAGAGSAADGSAGSAHTVRRPPPRPRPARPVKPAKPVEPGEATEPPKPPKPACDPFSSPRACK